MSHAGKRRSEGLWAITSYFNPAGFERRLTNYRSFRARLAVPLVTVELAHNDVFELRSEDADVLIQVPARDVLWQKERLLNLALHEVPRDCDKIAWLDCDVVFDRNDWAERSSRELERFAIVQLFSHFTETGPDGPKNAKTLAPRVRGGCSLAYLLSTGLSIDDVFEKRGADRLTRGYTGGLAWAARRSVVERHGFYDACILGGGDKAMNAAAFGAFDQVRTLQMNPRQIEHYIDWAQPYAAEVRGCVGHVKGRICHLWHGELGHRSHRDRHVGLRRFGFDPFVDIALDRRQLWRWNSDKPAMHAYVREYFEARREDG